MPKPSRRLEAKETHQRIRKWTSPFIPKPRSLWSPENGRFKSMHITAFLSFPIYLRSLALEDASYELSLSLSVVPSTPRTRVHHQDLFRFHCLLSGLLTLRSGGLLLLLGGGGTLGGRLSLGRGPEGLENRSLEWNSRQENRDEEKRTRLSRRSCMMRVESL